MRHVGFFLVKEDSPLNARPSMPTPIVFEPATPPKWTYHVVTVDLREEPPLGEERLAELGAEGWLLASTVSQPAGSGTRVTYYFVRAA